MKQHVGRRRERHALDQDITQGTPADWKIRRRTDRADDCVRQRRIVGRVEAERVADHVLDPAAGQVELDVPGLLLGAFLVEPRTRSKARHCRRIARDAGRCDRCRLFIRRGDDGGRGRRRVHLLVEFLEHAGGVFATRHAQVQPLFLLGKQRVRIVVAVVAALTAVLLRHRGHHAPPQRTAFRELHAVGKFQRLIVPGRFTVVAIARRRTRHQRGRLFRSERCHAPIERHQAGKETIEPGALLGRKRRGFGNQ